MRKDEAKLLCEEQIGNTMYRLHPTYINIINVLY